MEVYLDNSATTKVSKSVKKIILKTLDIDYGNPSSLHKKGMEAENHIKEARENIAKTLKVTKGEIYFTSGGTEANNLAIIGCANGNIRAGKHIITTQIEHPSVSNSVKYLESLGFHVTYLPVDKNAIVDLDYLKNSITKETILVSIIYLNNEIGVIQPIDEIAKIIKSKNEKTLLHVDAVQAYGKIKMSPTNQKIDLMTMSGHKIHGPKGIGAIYIRDRVKVIPLIHGGEQEKQMRSGTENVSGIVGFGLAAKEIHEGIEDKINYLYELKEYFVKRLKEMEEITINGLVNGGPHIVNVSFVGIRSEVLLHTLEERGIYVSAGSACASKKNAHSPTLKAMGLDKYLLESTIRFSFSFETTKEELLYCIDVLKEILPILRRYKRK